MLSKVLNFGQPGILYSTKRLRVNDFDVSTCAKSFLGPTTPTLISHKESAIPAAKGFSGPIIAKSISCFFAYFCTVLGSSILSILISSQILDMPGLLLLARQYIFFFFFDLEKDRIIACSRAPEPITRIFTIIK